MTYQVARVIGIAVLVSITAAGCARKARTRPAPVRINADSIALEQARRDSLARAEAARAAAAAAAAAVAAAGPTTTGPISATERTTMADMIYFDLDESALTSDSRAIVEAKAPILLRRPNLRIRITGHADAQGSDEYNLALGLRRAAEAKRYLVGMGIEDSRIEIVTMGEERPAVQGNTQEAYALNRRAEFEVISGG